MLSDDLGENYLSEKLRGYRNFALFAHSYKYYGKYVKIAVVQPSSNYAARKVAFVVSKKCQQKSVSRNKFKRWLRELYRKYRDILPVRVWLMIVSLPGRGDVGFQNLECDIKQTFELISSKNGRSVVRKNI